MKSPSKIENIIVETNGLTIHFTDGGAEFYPISRESRLEMALWLLTAEIKEKRKANVASTETETKEGQSL